MQPVKINGAVEGDVADIDLIVGVPYGELPTPKARKGYTFGGWFTGPNGTGRRVTAQSLVEAGDGGLYAHWLQHAYTVRFNANGGEGLMSDQAFLFDTPASLDSNAFVRACHDFAGWATNATVEALYADGAAVTNLTAADGGTVDLYATWQRRMHTVSFYRNKALKQLVASRDVGEGLALGTLPATPVTEGCSFVGWRDVTVEDIKTAPAVNADTVVTGDMTICAAWTANVYTVTFNACGGTVSVASKTAEYDSEIGELPTATREGYAFDGWFTTADGGEAVSAATVVTGNVTYYAHWTEIPPELPMLWPDGVDMSDAVSATAASVYDGYLFNKETGALAGTVQVKVGKPNKKTNLASVKAAVVGLDGRKKSLKAVEKGKAKIESGGPTTVELVGGDACEVTLGAYGMSGTYGAYAVDGALNVFASKSAADRATAASILGRWQGSLNMAWRRDEDNAPCQTLTVTIANKGKAKVAGALADGTKVSVNSQLIVGDEWCCVPVLETKKSRLAFAVWLPRVAGGEALPVVAGLENAIVGRPGTLVRGAAFRLKGTLGDARYAECLPDGMPIAVNGRKWVLPKAGKVQLTRDGGVDVAKLLENPSALKLTYTAKTGAFKGSFKAYGDVRGKPKAVTVNVAGVLIDGVGYGSASIRKGGSVAVRIDAED